MAFLQFKVRPHPGMWALHQKVSDKFNRNACHLTTVVGEEMIRKWGSHLLIKFI